MVYTIVKYGDPVLRQKGAPVSEITPEVKQFVADMLETMRSARGVGLAAQQVGKALQLAVIDVRGVTDRPSSLQIEGKESDVEAFMPLVLINPKISPVGPPAAGPEGCLSFPEMYADIERPERIEVVCTNAEGERLHFQCGGLLARAIQHEVDHLNGILFIDRMDLATRRSMKSELDALQEETKAQLKAGARR